MMRRLVACVRRMRHLGVALLLVGVGAVMAEPAPAPAPQEALADWARQLHDAYAGADYDAVRAKLVSVFDAPNLGQRGDGSRPTRRERAQIAHWQAVFDARMQAVPPQGLPASVVSALSAFGRSVDEAYDQLLQGKASFGTANARVAAASAELTDQLARAQEAMQAQQQSAVEQQQKVQQAVVRQQQKSIAQKQHCQDSRAELTQLQLEQDNWAQVTESLNATLADEDARMRAQAAQQEHATQRQMRMAALASDLRKRCR